jgi:hypothetical protein
MRIFKLILKFFKRTEVPLTPEQEVALREQLRIMDDLARHSRRDSVGNVPRTLPQGWETGIGGKAVEDHEWRDPKLNP